MSNRMFELNDYFIVTGVSGLLGREHAKAIMACGGSVIGIDLNSDEAKKIFGNDIIFYECNITKHEDVEKVKNEIYKSNLAVKGLVNNAAINPSMDKKSKSIDYFESFDMDSWNLELSVGLTGAVICTKIFGNLIKDNGGGSIVNVSSDLGIIAPDQRIYKNTKKPVSYSVIKHGIIGLTKYTSTYWSQENVRCNALIPGGVKDSQDQDFVNKLEKLIPMGRMAEKDDYHGALIFLLSVASSYMTGSSLVVDGGRTCW